MVTGKMTELLNFHVLCFDGILVHAIQEGMYETHLKDQILELAKMLPKPVLPELAEEILIGIFTIDPNDEIEWQQRIQLIGIIKISIPHKGKYLIYWGEHYLSGAQEKYHYKAFDIIRHIAAFSNREIVYYKNESNPEFRNIGILSDIIDFRITN